MDLHRWPKYLSSKSTNIHVIQYKIQSLQKYLMLVACCTVPRCSWLSACFLLLVALLS